MAFTYNLSENNTVKIQKLITKIESKLKQFNLTTGVEAKHM